MCLILIAYRIDSETPLIVGANRDEHYARPTAGAEFWSDKPNIFAGRDLQARGTWLGVSTDGRFAAIANRNRVNEVDEKHCSRGLLVSDFLNCDLAGRVFISNIDCDRYNGFNLVVYDGQELTFFSNCERDPIVLTPGFFAITNNAFGESTKRSRLAIDRFSKLTGLTNVYDIFAVLQLKSDDREIFDREKDASSESQAIFVQGDSFGTRSSTVVIYSENNLVFCEQQYRNDSQFGNFTQRVIRLS